MTAPTDIAALKRQPTDAGLTHGPLHEALERTRGAGQKMHRRAQIAEGKLHRTVQLLDLILETMKMDMKPPKSAELHSYFHNVMAARNHARIGSGRAFSVAWGYFHRLQKETEADRDRLAGELAEARARVAGLQQQINEATDPDFIWGAMDNVNDMDADIDEFAKAASRAIRAALYHIKRGKTNG